MIASVPFARRYAAFYPPELRDHAPAESSWWDWDGLPVHINRIPAPDAPFVLVVAHGAGGYGELFLPFAGLAGPRAEFVAPDLPGYGRTRPHGPVDYGMWVRCLSDLVRAESGRDGRPVVLLGASMGGLLAYEVAATVGAAGLIATCLLDPRDPQVLRHTARFGWAGGAAGPALGAAPWLTDRLRPPIRWLVRMAAMSNDPGLSALVASDPSGGGNRVSLRFLRTFLACAPTVEPEDFDTCPVLLAHPGADRWTPEEISRPFFDRIAGPKQLVTLENCGHLPVEQPGLEQLGVAVRRFLDGLAP